MLNLRDGLLGRTLCTLWSDAVALDTFRLTGAQAGQLQVRVETRIHDSQGSQPAITFSRMLVWQPERSFLSDPVLFSLEL